jgi:ParB family chromosome partitioning protein
MKGVMIRMKTADSAMLYNTHPVVSELNRVKGFDPLRFMKATPEGPKLELKYKKIWFRLKYPQGRFKYSALKITDQLAIIEARVYFDKNDPEAKAAFTARSDKATAPGGMYIEATQYAAIDQALTDAGFGIQFAQDDSDIISAKEKQTKASKKEETPAAVKSPEINVDDLKDAVTVRISEVEPNRKQPRKNFDDEKLEELAESIKTFGLLQPILVQKRDGYYEIIAGERRWRAALKAGLKEVPVIIRDYTEKEILELSLIENIQRENLNPIEEAQAYKRLMDEFGLGQAEVAQRVSKSRPAVANSLRLLKLEENVQKMLIDGQISMGHARALLPLEIPEEQLAVAQKIAEKELSVRETEKLVKELLKTGTGKKEIKPVEQKEDPSIEIIYRQIEERLQQTLHTKVSIQRKRNGHGKLLIDFYNSDDLEKIIDRLTDR